MGLSFSRQEPHKRTQLPIHKGSIPLGGDIDRAEGQVLVDRDSPDAQKSPLSYGGVVDQIRAKEVN